MNTELQCHQILTRAWAINKPVWAFHYSYNSNFTELNQIRGSEFASIFLPASQTLKKKKRHQWCRAKFLSWVYSLYSLTFNWLQPVKTMVEGVTGSAYTYILQELTVGLALMLRRVSWAGMIRSLPAYRWKKCNIFILLKYSRQDNSLQELERCLWPLQKWTSTI